MYCLEDLALALYKRKGMSIMELSVIEMLHSSKYEYAKEAR